MDKSGNEIKYLDSMADMVDEYLKSKAPVMSPNHQLFEYTRRCLPRIVPGKTFEVGLVTISVTKNPFIMRIYPDATELNNVAEELFTAMNSGKSQEFFKAWSGIKKYHIEIDERLFMKNSSLCVDDGRQFVGILCHELGHATYEDPKTLLETYMTVRYVYDKTGVMMMNKNPLVRKLCLPMFLATSTFKLVIKKSRNSARDEIMADSFVPVEYREDLIAYFDNHILNNVEVSKFVTTEEEYKNDQKTNCTFSRNVINNIKTRRKILKSGFKAQYDTEESPYLKAFVKNLGSDALGYDVEADLTNTVYENYVISCFERDEAEFSRKSAAVLEVADVTPRDISILQIQAQDVDTSEKKLFVVHTIYDYLETLQAKKEKILKKCKGDIDDAKRFTSQYDSQIEQLNSILKQVMNVDTSGADRKYGLFIKYPKGYEG